MNSGVLEGKVSTDKWFKVRLVDATDGFSPETGVAFGDVTVKYSTEAATSLTTYTVTTDDWKEAGEGDYWLRIGASEFTAAGKYGVTIAAAVARTVALDIEVSTYTFQDLFSGYNVKLKLDQLDIQAQDTNTDAIIAIGNGTGDGIDTRGGNDGIGFRAMGGGNSGVGMLVKGQADHALKMEAGGIGKHGVYSSGAGTGGHGLLAEGTGNSAHGAFFLGGLSGEGVYAKGGTNSGSGIKAESQDDNAVEFIANGVGYDGLLTQGSGDEGHGIQAIGGGTSGGHGIYARAFGTGSGINAFGGDSGGHGIHAHCDGAGSSTGNGILAQADAGIGHGFHAAGKGTGHGAYLLGGTGGGDGLLAAGNSAGGATAGGSGIHATSPSGASGDSDAIRAESASQTGKGMRLKATGSSGHGLYVTASDQPAIQADATSAFGTIAINNTGVSTNAAAIRLTSSNSSGLRCDAGGNAPGIDARGSGTGAGMKLTGGVSGKDFEAKEIGTLVDLNGNGASLSGNTQDIYAKAVTAATAMKLTDTVDGVAVSLVLEILMAAANGRFVITTVDASTKKYTFYKRDNATVLWSVNVTTTTRTRN